MSDYLDLAKKAMADQKVDRVEPGCLIHWQTWDGKTHGPALVEHVTLCDGRRWAWVTWDGMERAVSEVIITAVEPGELENE